MARLVNDLAGIGVEPLDLVDALAVNTGTSTTSWYQQAGFEPGDAETEDDGVRMTPILTGQQLADLEIVSLVSGMPMLSIVGSAQLGWRFAGETAAKIRGWIAPNWLTGVLTYEHTTSGSTSYPSCGVVTHPQSQKVVNVYKSGTTRVARTYSPGEHAITPNPKTTAAREIRNTWDPSDAVVCFPSTGRIVAIVANRSYRSDDVGHDWTLHSSGVFASEIDWQGLDYARAAASADGSALYVGEEETSGTLTQGASVDGLATVQLVGTWSGERPTVAALPGGGYAVAWVADTTDYPRCVRLASPWQPIGDLESVVIASTACDHVVLVADPDGLLTAYYSPSGAAGQIRMSVSLDGGATWTAYTEGCLRSLSTDRPLVEYVGTASAGTHILSGQSDANTATVDGSLWIYRLGGYSTLIPSIPGWTTARDFTGRGGTGFSSGQSNCSWTPIELPGDASWTAAGTATQTLMVDGVRIQATAGQTRTYERDIGATDSTSVCVVEVVAIDGGDLTTNEIALRKRISNATDERELVIALKDDGQVRARDGVANTTLGTVTMAQDAMLQIMVQVSTSSAIKSGAWVRYPYESVWTEIWTGDLTNDTASPAGTSRLQWGHIAASAGNSDSRWRMVCDTESTQLGYGIAHPQALGRPVSARPYPLSIEAGVGAVASSSGEYLPLSLSAVGGPAALKEVWSIDRRPTHPITRIFADESPSPSEPWRTVDKSEQLIVFDFARNRWLGDTLALVAINVNFRAADLQYYDGAAWQTLGSLDLASGFTATNGIISGSSMIPAAATSAGGRYLQAGELVGGYAVIDTGSPVVTAARRITGQTPGWWRSGTGQPEPRITMTGISGTENASTAAILVARSGVLVVHLGAITVNRRWRIRIPANQVSPDAYYEAGLLSLMRVQLLGSAPAWGWSQETAQNVQTSRARNGATTAAQLGPPITTWSMDWADGTDLRALRSDGSAVDWQAPTGGYTSGGVTAEDVGWVLRGVLEETRSGADPVLVLAAVPESSGVTITDRTLWHYGRMTTSIRLDHLLGTEGEAEVVRVATVSIAGIP
jgi:hypothetical protein